MERHTFNQQMARLSVAFDRVLTPPLVSTYWDRVKNHRDDLFTAAVDLVIDTGDHFPNIAAVHRQYYRLRDERAAPPTDGERSEDAALELGRRNAARLAKEGLPSDVMLASGRQVAKRVGGRDHEAVLRTYDRLIETLSMRVDERYAQLAERPNDHELTRRAELLAETLSETVARRNHFAATGETLPVANLAHDAAAVPPGTLYLCPLCKATEDAPGRYLRIEATPHSAHFGVPIPCPRCRPGEYEAYVAAKGQPAGLPWPEPALT